MCDAITRSLHDAVRYTKTLTTPFDLSRCLFDGLAKGMTIWIGSAPPTQQAGAAWLRATMFGAVPTANRWRTVVPEKGDAETVMHRARALP